ncbi:MAG TPA: YciI family protein [Pyrinomonadaceae bacterium]|nr:YciI family protein [Pyrinomonadaceae bacterium]
MKYVLLLCVALGVTLSAFAQPPAAKNNPNYDAELAKRLGANDMGLRNYVLAILKTGPNDTAIQGDERSKVFRGHFENMTRLSNEGKLAVAGPFGKNDKSFRGLFIFAVPTVEEAKLLTETDPAVKAGILVVEYVPWFGSASLMATPDIHKKIAKTSP